MLRTKLTDNEAQRENLNKIRNEESRRRSDQIGLETLDDDMPDLEAAQVVSRDSSSEVTVNSVPHILGSVQVYLDNMFTSSDVDVVHILILLFLKNREIQATWSIILSKLQKVGVQCIVDIFELHPFIKEHFLGLLLKNNKVADS